MPNNQESLLRVEHLCQYFGRAAFKAVDDVSFDIKKGEVFGLVGESGCGKTTTGRAIIKLYNITSGNVYFKGIRISAGKRSYQEAIKAARAEFAASGKTAEGAGSRSGPPSVRTTASAASHRPRYASYQLKTTFSVTPSITSSEESPASQSTSSVFCPFSAKSRPSRLETVDLPTPPLPDAIRMLLVMAEPSLS